MQFKVFRALDGACVSGTSPDRPRIRAPRKAGG
jgi:hypothetical protein